MPANQPTDTETNDAGAAESPLVWGTSTFEPGSDVGLVSRHTVGLVERDNPSTRDRLWRLVAADAPLDDVLDELSSTGLKALPDFGIAQVEGDSIRVVARGRTSIVAELTSGDSHEIDASDVRTWIEEVVADVVGLTITLPPRDGEEQQSSDDFAVLAGSVPARSITRRFDVADPHADEAAAGWSADAASGIPSIEPELAAAQEVELALVDEDVDVDVDVDADAGGDVDAGGVGEGDVDVDAGGEGVGVGEGEGEAKEGGGDSWFEDNQDDADRAPIPPQPADPQPVSAQPSGPPAADAQPASPQPSGPPAADAQPASPQPSGPPAADAQPASPQPAAPPAVPGAGGPAPEATVVVGPADGPARGPVSAIFDDEVADAPSLPPEVPPQAAATPVFGVLAFSNGERISVDRSVLIGRNPKVAGAVEGGLPHIMKFDGPGQGLSRTHAEVRVENGEMVLEDLQSTNGTEIQLPGQIRRRVRAGEAVVVVPGTLIDFGDELHCTVETA